jgi:hypothetical protein
MSEDEFEDLRATIEQWAEDEGVPDRELAAALRKLAAEYATSAR